MAKIQAEKIEETPLAKRLQDDIFAEKFRPGEWLKQADIESTYSANRFEVRIALSTLAARHLIDHIPNKGYRVINPSDRERTELYEVRTILETAAARMVVQKASDEDIDTLASLVEAFSQAIDTQPVPELIKLNMEFHHQFYELCGNQLLADQIHELRQRGLPGRRGAWETRAGIKASHDDHVQMIEALRNGDADGLAYTVYRHLNRWREYTKPKQD